MRGNGVRNKYCPSKILAEIPRCLRKWATIQRVFGEVSGREVEVEILRQDEEALEIDVTRCRFAEFFRALGVDSTTSRVRAPPKQ
jgi:hypothetical protein